MATSFLKKNSTITYEKVDQIQEINRLEDQPDFIHMFSINGQEIAFLGDRPADPQKFQDHHIRIDKMIIPKFARMVNYDILKETIRNGSIDGEAVCLDEEGVLYDTKLEETILVNIPGSVKTHPETRLLHHCHNFEHNTDGSGGHAMVFGIDGLGVCRIHVLSSSFSKDKKLHQKPIIFYLSSEDLEEASRLEAERYKKVHEGEPVKDWSPAWSMKNKLSYFFEEQIQLQREEPIDLKMGNIAGVFLIPTLGPDQGVFHQCILNVAGGEDANRGMSTVKNLNEWIEAEEKLNSSPDEYEMVVAVDDLFSCELEEWSCSISKNAYPLIKHTIVS